MSSKVIVTIIIRVSVEIDSSGSIEDVPIAKRRWWPYRLWTISFGLVVFFSSQIDCRYIRVTDQIQRSRRSHSSLFRSSTWSLQVVRAYRLGRAVRRRKSHYALNVSRSAAVAVFRWSCTNLQIFAFRKPQHLNRSN